MKLGRSVVWLIAAIVLVFAFPLHAQSAPLIEDVTQWLASKVGSSSSRERTSGRNHVTEKYSLKQSGPCEITFENVIRSADISVEYSSIEEINTVTVIPLSKISANSLDLIEHGDGFLLISFNAAKDKPYHFQTITLLTSTGADPRKEESEGSNDLFTFSIRGASLAARMIRALRFLAEQCNAENEPF